MSRPVCPRTGCGRMLLAREVYLECVPHLEVFCVCGFMAHQALQLEGLVTAREAAEAEAAQRASLQVRCRVQGCSGLVDAEKSKSGLCHACGRKYHYWQFELRQGLTSTAPFIEHEDGTLSKNPDYGRRNYHRPLRKSPAPPVVVEVSV